MKSTIVDDTLDSVDSEEAAINLLKGLVTIYGDCGMKVAKFVSSSPAVLAAFPEDDRHVELHIQGLEPTTTGLPHVTTLGLIYQMNTDQFIFRAPAVPDSPVWTKRTILSHVQRTFDPLGLVSPLLVTGRAVFQDSWRARLAWDEPLTHELRERWTAFIEQLAEVSSLTFSRPLRPADAVPGSEALHCFSDASGTAYGACVYLTTRRRGGEMASTLVASRTRLAPIKMLTTPRLELCGAVIAAVLAREVKRDLGLSEDVPVNAWSDSVTVLSWIKNQDLQLKIFVANRIQRLSNILPPHHWNYVPTTQNPADLLSRGAPASHLAVGTLWQDGPPFLRTNFTPPQPETLAVDPEELLTSRHPRTGRKEPEPTTQGPWPDIKVWGPLEEVLTLRPQETKEVWANPALQDIDGDGYSGPKTPLAALLVRKGSWLRAVRIIARLWTWRLGRPGERIITEDVLRRATLTAFRLIQEDALGGTR